MPELWEIADWLGISIFEMLMHIIGLFVFTILLAIRLEADERGAVSMDWFVVFSPLYCVDLICAYFGFILAFRLYLVPEVNKSHVFWRFMWRIMFLSLLLMFKLLFCWMMEGTYFLNPSDVFVPLFLLLQILAIRACRLKALLSQTINEAQHQVIYNPASNHEPADYQGPDLVESLHHQVAPDQNHQ